MVDLRITRAPNEKPVQRALRIPVSWKSGVNEHRDRGGIWDEVVQLLDAFCQNFIVNPATPVILPPGRLRLATSRPLTGFVGAAKTIGIVEVAVLAAWAERSPPSHNDRHAVANQIGCQCGESIELVICEAVLDGYVLSLDETSFAQPLADGGQKIRAVRR
jgi:hypothetical protein